MPDFINSAIFETTQYLHPFACFTKTHPFPLHLHKHLEFIYITHGEVELHLHKKSYTLKAGDCTLITPYSLHGYSPKDNSCKRFVLVFEPETIGVLGELLLNYHPTQSVINSQKLQEALPIPLTTLFKQIANSPTQGVLEQAHQFYAIIQLLNALLPLAKLEKQASNKSTAFTQAINLCNASYDDADFSIQSIANTLHISESYIKQLFSREIGTSVKKYLTMLRIGKAETLLSQASLSIAAIAQESGFGSVRTFNRVFKEQKGITPYAFRDAAQAKS